MNDAMAIVATFMRRTHTVSAVCVSAHHATRSHVSMLGRYLRAWRRCIVCHGKYATALTNVAGAEAKLLNSSLATVGSTGYIDCIRASEMGTSIVFGQDNSRRSFLAARVRTRSAPGVAVCVYFQRYAGIENIWAWAGPLSVHGKPSSCRVELNEFGRVLRAISSLRDNSHPDFQLVR